MKDYCNLFIISNVGCLVYFELDFGLDILDCMSVEMGLSIDMYVCMVLSF